MLEPIMQRTLPVSYTHLVKAEVGLENIKTVVTGGLGRIIANETDAVDIYDPNLTLKGINLVYKKQNRKIK